MVNHNQKPNRRNYSHEFRLECLRSCFHEWRASEAGKRLADYVMGVAICEAVDELGMADELEAHGSPVHRQSNAIERGQMMMRSIWRWLGCTTDCKAQAKHIFLYERAILKAFPASIAMRYLESILPPALQVSELSASGSSDDVVSLIQAVHKECSEAVGALLPLTESSSDGDLREVDREISEAIDALASMQECVRSRLSAASGALQVVSNGG